MDVNEACRELMKIGVATGHADDAEMLLDEVVPLMVELTNWKRNTCQFLGIALDVAVNDAGYLEELKQGIEIFEQATGAIFEEVRMNW